VEDGNVEVTVVVDADRGATPPVPRDAFPCAQVRVSSQRQEARDADDGFC
jgi:hypothetical protein